MARMDMAASKTSPAVSPVIVIAGEEAFLRNQMLAEIKQAVLGQGDPGMALVRLDGATAIATVLDEARTLPCLPRVNWCWSIRPIRC